MSDETARKALHDAIDKVIKLYLADDCTLEQAKENTRIVIEMCLDELQPGWREETDLVWDGERYKKYQWGMVTAPPGKPRLTLDEVGE